MTELDLILRGGTVVTHQGEFVADLGIAGGKIAALDLELQATADEIVDARGLHIFPGLIDAHVHFNEPGRTEWEGVTTGSQALAAGGGTMFFDMPLNAHPPTIDGASFDAKLAVAEAKSLVDFGLWGGLVLGNLDNLEELSERGVVGFKAFMCHSGIEDFLSVDEATLREGMKRAAARGKVVAVHAESEAITSELTRRAMAGDRTTLRDYLESRPIYAELEAIHRAVQLAGETKCALHIVHVSSGAGVALVASAQKQGVNVTCETCPHYLVLTEADLEQLGAVAKCAPPLRSQSAQDVLWRYVEGGHVATVGSDHSPAPPEMKQKANFFHVWGGIAGVQHTLPLLVTGFRRRSAGVQVAPEGAAPSSGPDSRWSLALQSIARLTSYNVAERFKLPPAKGRLVVGADADLALVDLRQEFTVRVEDLFARHKLSPYLGRTLTGRVVRTILRGTTIFAAGKVAAAAVGRLVKPIGS